MAAPTYVTQAELKDVLNVALSGLDSANIDDMLVAAENLINNFCRRPDGFKADSTATARLFHGTGKAHQFIDECVAVTAVEVKDSATDSTYDTWASTDYIVATGGPALPVFQPTSYGLPITMLLVDPTGNEAVFSSGAIGGGVARPTRVPTVRVTAKWGYSATVPQQVKQAVIGQVASWIGRHQSLWAEVRGTPELGEVQMTTSGLDPQIKFILEGAGLRRHLYA